MMNKSKHSTILVVSLLNCLNSCINISILTCLTERCTTYIHFPRRSNNMTVVLVFQRQILTNDGSEMCVRQSTPPNSNLTIYLSQKIHFAPLETFNKIGNRHSVFQLIEKSAIFNISCESSCSHPRKEI